MRRIGHTTPGDDLRALENSPGASPRDVSQSGGAEPSPTVKLKNGTVEAKGLVVAVILKLQHLRAELPTALYDLVMKCRCEQASVPCNPLYPNSVTRLMADGLIDSRCSIDEPTRNVILNCTEGLYHDLRLCNPWA